MFIHNAKYLGIDALQAWWPQDVGGVNPLLERAPVVILWQCPPPLARTLQPDVFRVRPFHTPLIDLSKTEEELWQQLEAKSCRYEIRKAQKLDCSISINEDTEAARQLLNDSIGRLQYRGAFSPEQWQPLCPPQYDIFLCKSEGVPVAVHVMLLDAPHRARLLLSGSADRGDARFRKIVGPMNRLLHWTEIQHYKQKGFQYYDFGGCDVDKNAPEYSITQFKLSFGASVVEEPMLYLTKKPALRAFLQAAAFARNTLKRIPWPERCLKAIRTHPRIAELFH